MIIDKQKVRKELELRPFGQKGWMKNRILCPFCGDSDKWGILFIDEGGIFHCFKGKCDTKTSVFNFLKQIGRGDLIENKHVFSKEEPIRSIKELYEVEEVKEETVKKVQRLPYRCKPIISDPYLDDRGFMKQHYDMFKPVYTESALESKLHDYIIFQIFQNGELDSWLARSRKSKEWHEENLRKAKNGEQELVLRYMNSENTDFGNILGGLDDVTDNTEMVIFVEGLFDKVGIDLKLDLFKDESVRCCFTFGNKISDSQINLLKSKKSLKFVILFYDYGTTVQMKQYGMKLSRLYTTYIAVCQSKNDPSDMPVSEMNEIMDNLKTPSEFCINNLNSLIK